MENRNLPFVPTISGSGTKMPVFGPEASLANAILGEEPSSYGNTKPGGPLVPQRISLLKEKQAERFY